MRCEELVERFHENTGEVVCLQCLEENQLESYQHLGPHLKAKHDLGRREYRSKFGDVRLLAQSHIEAFVSETDRVSMHTVREEHVKSLDEIDIDDSLESITCRVCGKQQRQIYGHVQSHGINLEVYTELYPDAPTIASHGELLEYDWSRLNITDQTVSTHCETLYEIERSWVLSSQDVFDEVVEEFNDTGEKTSFLVSLGACLYIVLKKQVPSVTPGEVADVVNVEDTALMREVRRRGLPTQAPEDQLYSRLEDIETELDAFEYDQVRQRLDELPEFKYNQSYSTVIAYCVWDATDKSQKKAGKLVDVTSVALRNFRDKLEDAAEASSAAA